MLTKPNILRLVFFILAFAAALYYPIRKVLAFERPAVPPTELRFRVKGYDPYDPARGHYLRLDTEVELKFSKAEFERQKSLLKGCTKAFAVLETGKDGLTAATALTPVAPEGKPFVTIRKFWYGEENYKDTTPYVSFYLPFDRYYLNEKLAGPAEKLLFEATSAKKPAVLVVAVYADGSFVVRDLLIGGKPLREHLVPKKK